MAPATETTTSANAWKPRSTLVGALLVNRYKISQFIGQGSTGAVYRADDVLSNRPVAVRVLAPHVAQLDIVSRIRARIERNAEIKRKHPDALINLVDAVDIGLTLEGETFVVTDYIEGDHLASMLVRGGRLPWSRAKSLLVRLCQLLHGFHQQGIVLGTLQARHCYAVRGRPKSEAIKITSTVLLEQLTANLGPSSGAAGLAMARYVAPEQACGEPTDPRTDVYSLGVIAYELLTGRLPFEDSNAIRLVSMHLQAAPPPPRQIAADAQIPAAVEQVILKALAKAPADRHATMDVFAAALSAVPELESSFTAAPYPGAAPLPSIPAAPVAPPPLLAAAIPTPAAPPLAPPLAAIPTPAAPPLAPPLAAIPTPAAPPLAPPLAPPAAAPPLAPPLAPPPAPTLAAPPVPPASPLAAPAAPPASPLAAPATPAPTAAAPSAAPPAAAAPSAGDAAPPVPSASPTAAPASLLPPPIAPPAAPPLAAASPAPSASPAVPSLPGDPLGGVVMPPLRAPTGPLLAPPQIDGIAKISPSVVMRPVDAPAAPVPPPVAPAAPTLSIPKRPPSVPMPSAIIPPLRKGSSPLQAANLLSVAPPAPAPATAPADKPADAVAPAPTDKPADAAPAAAAAAVAAAATAAVATASAAADKPATAAAATVVTATAPTPAVTADKPAAAAAATAPASAAPKTLSEAPATRRSVPPPDVSPASLRAAALRAADAQSPSLSQISEAPSESIIAELPRRRVPWLAVIGLGGAIAAGAAAYVQTQSEDPPPTGTRGTEPPTLVVKDPQVIANKPNPTSTAKDPTPPPDRGDGLVPEPPTPPAPETPPEAKVEPSVLPDTPVDKPDTSKKPDKPDKPEKKKKKNRTSVEPEEEEEDVFDQLRKHMEAKKAAEAAREASITPAPPPGPAPTTRNDDAVRAKDTLDRARQAASQGNHTLAYSLAKQSYGIVKTSDALELMGVSACKAGNADNARGAANQLAGSRRTSIVDACAKNGITI